MSTKHSITTELAVTISAYGIDPETFYPEVEIEFSYVPGCPETGPSYRSGGEPATPDEIEVQSVKIINDESIEMPPDWWAEKAQDWIDDKGFDAAREKVSDDEESRAPDRDDCSPDDGLRDFEDSIIDPEMGAH